MTLQCQLHRFCRTREDWEQVIANFVSSTAGAGAFYYVRQATRSNLHRALRPARHELANGRTTRDIRGPVAKQASVWGNA